MAFINRDVSRLIEAYDEGARTCVLDRLPDAATAQATIKAAKAVLDAFDQHLVTKDEADLLKAAGHLLNQASRSIQRRTT